MQKIVVAFSGGLDTSVMVHWLRQHHQAEIITVTGHLGQQAELIGLEAKAQVAGASKSYVVDLQERFLQEFAWPALQAGALYEGIYPMGTALGRPLLAELLAEVALKEGASMVAHGCTGKGNDQVRFEVALKMLAPELQVLAPLREWEFTSREQEIVYAETHGIPVSATVDKPFSIDDNLWGVAIECGVLEDPTQAPPEAVYQLTVSPQDAPDEPVTVTIGFEEGVPVALDGERLGPVALVKRLNQLGGSAGVGRLDLIENRVVGIKSREVYEAPAAVILHTAHQELERLVLDRETLRFKQTLAPQMANLIYDGLWYAPLRRALQAFVSETQRVVSGDIRLELYKGNLRVLSRQSRFGLYDEELATYASHDQFNHQAAKGFIELYGLPYLVQAKVHGAARLTEVM